MIRKLIIFVIAALIIIFFINFSFFNNANKRSKATGETLDLVFDPAITTVNQNQDFVTTIKAKPSIDMTIRGYIFKIKFNQNDMAVKDINYQLGNVSLQLGDDNSTIDTVNKKGEITIQGENQTASGSILSTNSFVDIVRITFTAKTNSSSKIGIPQDTVKFYKIESDYRLSEIPANNLAVLLINDSSQTTVTTTISPSPTGQASESPTISPTTATTSSPTTTITGSVSPTMISPSAGATISPTTGNSSNNSSATVTLNLNLRFQGILKKPKNSNPVKVKVKIVSQKKNWESDYQIGDFFVNNDGVWSGKVIFNDVPLSNDYFILVKGPKHLQKRICDARPVESSLGSGSYNCRIGNINLQSGENNFDFTGILLLAGDLPLNGRQDGVINALDTTFIRNNLGKTDSAIVSVGDVNLDGIVDTQDWSGILQTLSIKGDDL